MLVMILYAQRLSIKDKGRKDQQQDLKERRAVIAREEKRLEKRKAEKARTESAS